MLYLGEQKGGYFQKLLKGSETSDMTSEGLGEMFEGDSEDMCAGNISASVNGVPSGGSCRRFLNFAWAPK